MVHAEVTTTVQSTIKMFTRKCYTNLRCEIEQFYLIPVIIRVNREKNN